MPTSMIPMLISLLIVGALVFVAVLLTNHHNYSFDKMEYQTDLLRIENSLTRENPASFNMSVVEADKLLDKALCEMGTQGKTMGERLKRVGKEKFSSLNSVWYVHKLRNQIAHEPGFRLEYAQAARALKTYRQALKDLGAI
ncbi:hypothetical protein IJG21_02430 [Candidatus Saccharibacteria bacterium]|nr:hypothetical protein [Candidatus Saccharibacteria bacterium]